MPVSECGFLSEKICSRYEKVGVPLLGRVVVGHSRANIQHHYSDWLFDIVSLSR